VNRVITKSLSSAVFSDLLASQDFACDPCTAVLQYYKQTYFWLFAALAHGVACCRASSMTLIVSPGLDVFGYYWLTQVNLENGCLCVNKVQWWTKVS